MRETKNVSVGEESGEKAEAYLSALIKLLLFIFILFIPLKDSIYEISNGLIALLFLFLIIKNKDTDFIADNRQALLIILLILISMTISNAIGDSGAYGWRKQVQFFYRYGLLYFAVLYFLNKNYVSLPFIFHVFLLSMGIQAANGIYQHIHGVDFLRRQPAYGGGRLTSAVFNPNPFGFIMMVGALGMVAYLTPDFLKKENRVKIILLSVLLGMFLFCLLYSGSRAAWLGLAGGGLYFTVTHFKQVNTPIKLIAVAVFIILLILLLNNELFLSRLNALLNKSYGYRDDLFKSAVGFILQSPFWGYGIREDIVFLELPIVGITSPHNAYLEIMVFLGLIGFLVYCGLFFAVFRPAIAMSGKRPIYLTILTGTAIYNFFAGSFIASQIVLSICCLLCAGMFFELKAGKTATGAD